MAVSSADAANSPLRDILNAMPGAVFAFKPGLNGDSPVFVNSTFIYNMEGRDEQELYEKCGGDFWQYIHPDDRARVDRICSQATQEPDASSSFDCRIITCKGNIRLARVLTRSVEAPDGSILSVNFWLNLGRVLPLNPDVETDPLTGLLSMHSFFEAMDERRAAQPKGLAVLYIDIVNFRSVNLRYGVASGDDFLCSLGRSLQDCFTDGIVARFDSDHFAVLAPSGRLGERAAQVRAIIRKFSPRSIDASIGACLWDDPFTDAEAACTRAKVASDENRRHENTYFSVFTPEMGKRLEISEYVVSSIDEAIARGWIKVFYQPIIRSITGQLCGMEALARWDDPARGLLPPVDFIKPLEDAQAIWKLDLCVIRQAASNIALREKQGLPEIPISINLSRMDFLYCDIFKEVESLVRELDIPRRMLHIEITESTMTSREDAVLKAIDAFKAAGYELWMDDFGSGYSTLNMLKDCSFDVLKMDMAFLRSDSPRSRSIITSVIAMDKRIGNRTLAEGVETAEQAEFLRNAGCEKMQGYFFGKPMPFEESLVSCIRRGISIEEAKRRPYYDSLGKVDFMSGSALGVVELKDGMFRILFMNSPLSAQARQDGLNTAGDIEAAVNARRSPVCRDLHKAADLAVRTKRSGEVLATFNGLERLIRYRLLSCCGEDSLFEVTVYDCSQIGYQGNVSALMNLRYLYTDIYTIDLREMTVKDCQRGDISEDVPGEPLVGSGGALAGMLPEIFPADRTRYGRFIDPGTLVERLDQADQGVLRGIFRTKDADGRFTWMSHRLLRMPNTVRTQALYAVRVMDVGTDVDEVELLRSDAYGKLTSPAPAEVDGQMLWENMLLSSPLPVFWKDKDRRFRGASRRFLDYYGFSSQSEIIGKTDEDMRWHPFNEPYRNDEEEILKTGEVHEGVPGKCISRNVSHNILSTKWPLYRNGQIAGLMGYFLDEQMLSRFAKSAGASRIDPDSGFATVDTFLDDLARYESDNRISGRQFGIILASVPEFKRLLSNYGRSAMLSVLKDCASVIRREAGPAASCTRIGPGQFAVITECGSRGALSSMARRIKGGIGAIRSAGGASCTLFARMTVIEPQKASGFRSNLLRLVSEIAADPARASGSFSGNRVVHSLLDEIPIGCCVLGPGLSVRFCNREAGRMLGCDPSELIGRRLGSAPLECTFANGSQLTSQNGPVMAAISSGQVQAAEVFMKDSDGSDVLARMTLVPIRDNGGDATETAAFFTPLADRRYNRALVRAIYEVATRDPVTGMPGRKFMESCLDEALESYRRTGHPFAVLLLDIDALHDLNSRHGHAKGDAVLRAVGSQLRRYGRKSDQFCRWGDDEFVGLLQIRTPEGAREAARRFIKLAGTCHAQSGGEDISFSAAIGIALPRRDDTVVSLIERADHCMFKAQRRGNGQIEMDADGEIA